VLFRQAYKLLDSKKVTRNFELLLCQYSQELKVEAATPPQKQAAQFVWHKARQISILIQEKLHLSSQFKLPSQTTDDDDIHKERLQPFLKSPAGVQSPVLLDEKGSDDNSDPDDNGSNSDPDMDPDLQLDPTNLLN
jgi:hypothetical protein